MRRRFAIVPTLVVLTLAASACSGSFGMPSGADRQGRSIHDLWQLFFVASVIVAAIVYGLLAFALLRYRARGRTEVVRSPREHPVLEITYTVIPIAIVAVLWFASWRTNQDVTAIDPGAARTVDVQAYSWGWRFAYPGIGVTVVSVPGGAPPELVLPVGTTTTIRLTSVDVIHAWYVPAFLYKHDAIPGRTATFDITPERTGRYPGACAEFCGLNHAYMRFAVRVVPASEFETWATSTAAAQGATGATAAAGATGATGASA